MRAICIYDPNSDGPFRGILLLEGETEPKEAIEEWSKHTHGEDHEEPYIREMVEGLKYFFMDPIAARRVSEALVPNYGSDSVNYVMNTYLVNLCAMFQVRSFVHMSTTEIDIGLRKFATDPEHILS